MEKLSATTDFKGEVWLSVIPSVETVHVLRGEEKYTFSLPTQTLQKE
jgi:hypothetical protein